jgi:pimeloyl-ACP methyl ester carboxylesterase
MYLLSRGAGYPVLFIHGIPTSGQLWSGVVQKMRDSFTCMAVDLPGLGKTPKVSSGLRQLETLAEKIEQIRVEHYIEKWHVVGHDAGAAIAVHYAHRFQDRVDRLALLSPALFPELKPFHLFRIIRSPVLGELLAPAVNAIFWERRDALRPGTTTLGAQRHRRGLSRSFFRAAGRLALDVDSTVGQSRRGSSFHPRDAAPA